MFACLHAPGNLPLLLECAGYFSPLIEEETSRDDVVFDVHGLSLIYGTPENIAAEINRRVGIPANIALATNPDAAVHAARGISGITVIPPGREAAMLAPLPLHLLGGSFEERAKRSAAQTVRRTLCSSELARTLNLWGLRTFGEFAALPPAGVAARLGDEGIRMQQLARGEGHRKLRLRTDPLEFREKIEPDTPIDLIEPLLLLLSVTLHRLCDRLRANALSTNEIRISLILERAPAPQETVASSQISSSSATAFRCGAGFQREHPVTLRFPVPLLDPMVFLKLLHLELNSRPPQSPVETMFIEMIPVETRKLQHGLFLPATPEPEKLEITLARIRNLVGPANVGAPELLDTHRPDSFRTVPLRLAPWRSTNRFSPQLVLRRFRPPRPVRVWCTDNGQPGKIISPKKEWRVVACSGPWRTSGDWWKGEPWDCDEWDVEVSDNSLFRIHQDHRMSRWCVEGSYD
jgi:protein ImuB